jgi:hypothetical protein
MPILNEMNGVGQKCIASALHLRANAPETVTETVTVTETDKPPVREILPGIEPPAKAPDQIPDTPHQAIVDAYHRVLPELPRIRDWHANRQANLRVLWKRIATKKRWPSQAEGVDFFARYFAYVRTCPLLMGTVPGKAWSADLEWLTKTGNYTKVIEGKYLP